MRKAFFCWLLATLPVAGQSTQSSSSWLPPLNLPSIGAAEKPISELNATAFFAKDFVNTPATALPSETRTSAQLEALLSAYVGTWQGVSTWYILDSRRTLRVHTRLVYKMEKQDGRNVLTCTITYGNPGAPTIVLSRLWVESGHIFSETTEGGTTQKYIAQSRGLGLAWRTFGSMDSLFNFAETETLRLTADGGEISSNGFEVQPNPFGNTVVIETTELKLMK